MLPDESHTDVVASRREAVLSAATTVFIRHGYVGATMDEVAQVASVSKKTVYQHFGSKEALFRAVALATVDRGHEYFRPHIERLRHADQASLAEALIKLAEVAHTGLLSPELVRMRRLVMAEAERFPELAGEYYRRSWGRSIEQLAGAIDDLRSRALVRVPAPEQAAHTFVMLVAGQLLNQAAYLGPLVASEPAGRHRDCVEGVRVFLAAYGCHDR